MTRIDNVIEFLERNRAQLDKPNLKGKIEVNFSDESLVKSYTIFDEEIKKE